MDDLSYSTPRPLLKLRDEFFLGKMASEKKRPVVLKLSSTDSVLAKKRMGPEILDDDSDESSLIIGDDDDDDDE